MSFAEELTLLKKAGAPQPRLECAERREAMNGRLPPNQCYHRCSCGECWGRRCERCRTTIRRPGERPAKPRELHVACVLRDEPFTTSLDSAHAELAGTPIDIPHLPNARLPPSEAHRERARAYLGRLSVHFSYASQLPLSTEAVGEALSTGRVVVRDQETGAFRLPTERDYRRLGINAPRTYGWGAS